MRVIGLNGLSRSGKDTVYGMIAASYARRGLANVQRAAFADKIKVMGAKSIGWNGDDQALIALMDDFKEAGEVTSAVRRAGSARARTITGRLYLQKFGSHGREVFGDTFWIDQVLPTSRAALGKSYPGTDCLVVTDVRYPNEAERVKAVGGVVWQINRPGLVSDGHDSESHLPSSLYNYALCNDGDLKALEIKVELAIDTS